MVKKGKDGVMNGVMNHAHGLAVLWDFGKKPVKVKRFEPANSAG